MGAPEGGGRGGGVGEGCCVLFSGVGQCVCVLSSVRVLGWGGKVVAFCVCVLGNVYSYLMLRLCVDVKI